MKIKQRLILVQEDHYDDLAAHIGDWINTLEDTYEIQQIDFFCMDERDLGQPSAFVLFNPKV